MNVWGRDEAVLWWVWACGHLPLFKASRGPSNAPAMVEPVTPPSMARRKTGMKLRMVACLMERGCVLWWGGAVQCSDGVETRLNFSRKESLPERPTMPIPHPGAGSDRSRQRLGVKMDRSINQQVRAARRLSALWQVEPIQTEPSRLGVTWAGNCCPTRQNVFDCDQFGAQPTA